jgi:hypothetical protein
LRTYVRQMLYLLSYAPKPVLYFVFEIGSSCVLQLGLASVILLPLPLLPTINFNFKKNGARVVAHPYNPSYLWGWNQEYQGLKPAWAKSDIQLQSNQGKMDWRCVSHGRTPAFQAESPEFQPLILQQKITLFFTLCNRIMKNLKHTKEEVALKGLRLRAVSLCSLWRLSIFRTRSVPRSSRASEPHCAPHQAIPFSPTRFPKHCLSCPNY